MMALDIRKPLKKFLPYLLKAQEENLNEADTRQRIGKVFEDVLGYNIIEDLSREQQINEKYVDFAVKVDGVTRFLIEAKAAGIALRDRHIEQAQRYASEGNIRWVLLTNGVVWNLYHLTFEEGIDYELVFSVDLSKDPIEKSAEHLTMLHKQSIRKGEHEDFWQRRIALNPESIAKVLFTEEMLRTIRRQIRKQQGMQIDEEDLAHAMHEMFSMEARERIGPLRIRRRRKAKAKKQDTQKDQPKGSPDNISEELSDQEPVEAGGKPGI